MQHRCWGVYTRCNLARPAISLHVQTHAHRTVVRFVLFVSPLGVMRMFPIVAALGSEGAQPWRPNALQTEGGARVTYAGPWPTGDSGRVVGAMGSGPFTPEPSGPSGRAPLATVTIIAQISMRGGAGRLGTRSGLTLGGGSAQCAPPSPGHRQLGRRRGGWDDRRIGRAER
jgi:hypothetical protein